MAKPRPRRQKTRLTIIVISFLLFPLALDFFSPYLIIDGASQGIVNGSMILFGLLFLSALFVGRLWCAWACPAAGLQELCFSLNKAPARGGRYDWIKWGIWIPWIAIIVAAAVAAGGYHTVNPFHMMEDLVSPSEPANQIIFYLLIYYIVVGTIFVLSLTAGRRAFCHYGCWMAPFMILGRKLRNLGNWPSLRLQSDAAQCTDCQRCTRNCPMSLDVNGMVQQGRMEHSECILCGSCIDGCPSGAIVYSFSSGK